jgi:hypothetical protein
VSVECHGIAGQKATREHRQAVFAAAKQDGHDCPSAPRHERGTP